ncbi:hypothetical protein GGF32_009010 [Allomyces javanicus]|nr:hypothetical protein GGF32_009010 [Allomyces javanicus]
MAAPEANGLILAPSRTQPAPAPSATAANDTSHTILLALHVPLHAPPTAGPPPTVRICEPVLLSTPSDAARAHHVLGAVPLDPAQVPANVSPTVHQLLPTLRSLPGVFEMIARGAGNTPQSVPVTDEWFMKLKEGHAKQANESTNSLANATFLQLPPTTTQLASAPLGATLSTALTPASHVPTPSSAPVLPSFLAIPPVQAISPPQPVRNDSSDAQLDNDATCGIANNDQTARASNGDSNGNDDDDEVAQILSQINAASQAPAEPTTTTTTTTILPAVLPTLARSAAVPTSASAATPPTSTVTASTLPGTLPLTLPAAPSTSSFPAPQVPHATSTPFALPTAAPPMFPWFMPPAAGQMMPPVAPMAGHMPPPGAALPSLLPPAAPHLTGFMPPPAVPPSLQDFSAALGFPMSNAAALGFSMSNAAALQNHLTALGMLPGMLPPAAGADAPAQTPAPTSVVAAATAESRPDTNGVAPPQQVATGVVPARTGAGPPRPVPVAIEIRVAVAPQFPGPRPSSVEQAPVSLAVQVAAVNETTVALPVALALAAQHETRAVSIAFRVPHETRSVSVPLADMAAFPPDEIPFTAYFTPRGNPLVRAWSNRMRHALLSIGAPGRMQLGPDQGKITFTMPRRPGVVERVMQKSGLVLSSVRFEFEPVLSADKPRPPLHLPTLPVYILLNLPPAGVISDLVAFLTQGSVVDKIYLDLVGAVRPHKQWSFGFATVMPDGDPKTVEAMDGREAAGHKIMVRALRHGRRDGLAVLATDNGCGDCA